MAGTWKQKELNIISQNKENIHVLNSNDVFKNK